MSGAPTGKHASMPATRPAPTRARVQAELQSENARLQHQARGRGMRARARLGLNAEMGCYALCVRYGPVRAAVSVPDGTGRQRVAATGRATMRRSGGARAHRESAHELMRARCDGVCVRPRRLLRAVSVAASQRRRGCRPCGEGEGMRKRLAWGCVWSYVHARTSVCDRVLPLVMAALAASARVHMRCASARPWPVSARAC